MRILCVLLLTSMAFLAASAVKETCFGNPRGQFGDFNSRGNEVLFPCKYYALKRQRCGDWLINLTPGHVWLADNYYIDTYWIGINNTVMGKGWDGRTTNKVIVKYFNTNGTRPLFNKKNGALFADDIFDTGFVKEGKATVFLRDKNSTFQFTLTPWDPDNKNKYPHPEWKFECFNSDVTWFDRDFPEQLCGGRNRSAKISDVALSMDIKEKHKNNAIYYHVFMSDVVQMDEECIEAADIFQNVCPDNMARRKEVIENCAPILHNNRHTECVTFFQCSPMEAFNACLRWGCTGTKSFDKSEKDLCYEVGDAIDLCGDVAGPGNLTSRLRDANCFKEYLTVTYTNDTTSF